MSAIAQIQGRCFDLTLKNMLERAVDRKYQTEGNDSLISGPVLATLGSDRSHTAHEYLFEALAQNLQRSK